ncbi:methyl-accepting chemotaxis protein [Halomonas sp. A11-A]|uniref:methyl-accepting chemotaxis protein n=1 Tax=Halomonas sp. A11-A TaxID=2183985 RepID=UPI000D85C771|nr:methyl-accepting chemotaxis protein [Halomonas sp. A11-A]PWV74183.1 methyl-accepting chemotaxis protein (MCP) signaling protein [Halomonas sp. A11-A]
MKRSQQRLGELGGLIDRNGEVVKEGSTLVESVGLAMQDIVDNIGRVSALMDEVSHASEEQTLAIDQVSVALGQMDEVTQQNAALVEQIATASASLKDQARDLATSVRFFKVGKGASLSPDASQPPLVSAPRALDHTPAEQPEAGSPHRLDAPKRKPKSAGDEDNWESF